MSPFALPGQVKGEIWSNGVRQALTAGNSRDEIVAWARKWVQRLWREAGGDFTARHPHGFDLRIVGDFSTR